MMNIDTVIHNFLQQNTALSQRMQQALSYKAAAEAGEMSADEYQALMTDLQRLDQIQLSADELDQQIAFNNIINALKSVPLP
jgi:hypothetical protein